MTSDWVDILENQDEYKVGVYINPKSPSIPANKERYDLRTGETAISFLKYQDLFDKSGCAEIKAENKTIQLDYSSDGVKIWERKQTEESKDSEDNVSKIEEESVEDYLQDSLNLEKEILL